MTTSDIIADGNSFSKDDNQIEDIHHQQHEPIQPKTPTTIDIFSRLLIPENPIPDQQAKAEPIAIADVDQEPYQTKEEEDPTFNHAEAPSILSLQKDTSSSDSVKQAAAAAPPLPAVPQPAPGAPATPPANAPAPALPPKVPAAPPPPPKGPEKPVPPPSPKMGPDTKNNPPPKMGHDTKNNPPPPSIQTPAPPTPRKQERPPSEQMPNIPPDGPPPRPQPQLPPKAQAPPPANKPSLAPGNDIGSLGRIGVFGEDSFAVHNAGAIPFIHILMLCLVSSWFIMAMKHS